MAQRTVALCNGEYVGIESIFTVIDGRQINIPEKVKLLREKSRRNQLFCPCGCGANLTLVAGDRNLREQHFRLKDGAYEQDCHLITEGKCSVDSKIVLKCWLDDKLKDSEIRSRVPISDIDDTNRKYEFTLLSKKHALAISYLYERLNLSDEKISLLENNSKGIKIIYIVDEQNGGANGQYPENLMKIQARQGYCLYLSIEDIDYYKAKLEAVFFNQDIDGLWQEVSFAEDKISNFEIREKGILFYKERKLSDLLIEAKERFDKEQEALKSRREKEKKEQEERIARYLAKEKERQQEEQKRLEQKEAEAEQKRAKEAEKKRIEVLKIEQEKREREASFKAALEKDFSNLSETVRDSNGKRWIKCEFCGKIAMDSEFVIYGGPGHENLGTCYDCANKNSAENKTHMPRIETVKKENDLSICPICGNKLRRRIGKRGSFLGCSNYPLCDYTQNI